MIKFSQTLWCSSVSIIVAMLAMLVATTYGQQKGQYPTVESLDLAMYERIRTEA